MDKLTMTVIGLIILNILLFVLLAASGRQERFPDYIDPNPNHITASVNLN